MSSTWRATRPKDDEYALPYGGYIKRVPDGDVVETLAAQISETMEFLRAIPESKGDHRYAAEKWSIREVIGHLSDCERVFAYRALRFARADKTPVPGFDENAYVANARFGDRTLEDLTSEFEHVREASNRLFKALDEEAMSRRGVANNHEISVRAIAFIIAGHESHHREFLRTHYL